jgi:putative oxidoreductase
MAASDVRSNRAVSIILWVVQALTALMFLFAALGKFSGVPASVGSFNALGAPDWVRYLVGGLEVIGAVVLLIPPLCGLAALAFGLLMVGAVLTQVFAVGAGWTLPLVMLIIVAIIAWGRWPRTGSLIERLRPRAGTRSVDEPA